MAKKGTYPDAMKFMSAAMQRARVTSVPELAEKLGMNTPDEVRQFYKWANGENRPRLDNALPGEPIGSYRGSTERR